MMLKTDDWLAKFIDKHCLAVIVCILFLSMIMDNI